jgi:hypothetical protein
MTRLTLQKGVKQVLRFVQQVGEIRASTLRVFDPCGATW